MFEYLNDTEFRDAYKKGPVLVCAINTSVSGVGTKGKVLYIEKLVQISINFIIGSSTTVIFPFVASAYFH